MGEAKHAVKTLVQAIKAPCDGCVSAGLCEMEMACRDFELWHIDGRWRFRDRVPNRATYRRIFRDDDHVQASV